MFFADFLRYLPGNVLRFAPICGAVNRLQNEFLDQWVKSIAAVTTPDNIVVCDGSSEEIDALEEHMVATGTLSRLNAMKFPRAFSIARTRPMSRAPST